MGGLNNVILAKCGAEIRFYPGLPEFFATSKAWVADKPEYRKHDIRLEHYIVSTGLAKMIRGSAIAPHVDGVWGCEFIENPLQPGFLQQKELELSADAEIAQIGMVIDNTTKTRALFEINKGTNKNSAIDVNSRVAAEDRRIPFQNMIYIADGPSDVPSFSVVKGNGGHRLRRVQPGQAGGVRAERPPPEGRQDRPLRARGLHPVEQHDAVAAPAGPRDLRADRPGPRGAVSQRAARPPAPPERHARRGGRPAGAQGARAGEVPGVARPGALSGASASSLLSKLRGEVRRARRVVPRRRTGSGRRRRRSRRSRRARSGTA